MPTIKFTENVLRDLPMSSQKQQIYWDTKTKGLGLRVTAGAKTFVAQSRLKGKVKRISIGDLEEMSLEDARERAKKILVQISDGSDPNAIKAAERAKGITLEECFAEYCQWKSDLRPATVVRYQDVMNRRLKDWYKKRLTDITRTMVRERFKKIVDDIQSNAKTRNDAKPRDGYAEASLVFRMLSSLFNFAEAHHDGADGKSIITENPVKCLSSIKRDWRTMPKRQRVILPGELRKFHEGVQGLKSQTARDFLMLLILTGFRLNEAAKLTWDEINLDEGFILLPAERTKNHKPHLLPLPDYLLRMLEARKQFAVNEYVFASRKEGCANFTDPKRAINSVSEHMGKKFSAHDLRRTFETTAESLGIPPYSLIALLNHSNKGITGAYIIPNIERLREPMQQITNCMLDRMLAQSTNPDAPSSAPISMANYSKRKASTTTL